MVGNAAAKAHNKGTSFMKKLLGVIVVIALVFLVIGMFAPEAPILEGSPGHIPAEQVEPVEE